MDFGDFFVAGMTFLTEIAIFMAIAKHLIRYGIDYYLEKKGRE